MTSFNYGGKKARDVGLTCRFHLSNIMPGGIFYDSIECKITQFVFYSLRGGNHCLPHHRRDEFSIITITPMGRGNLKL